ncbi:hypothetical protein [Aquimarina celericrescens]|uniref:DUF6242 domain-containing protein n=1 Tax=Aquimarina celericrescens TaxID=1964542 RepID=A0ABW5AVC0_9FLAO|nr:hypothetical protein [Aquimarina celericrescens]
MKTLKLIGAICICMVFFSCSSDDDGGSNPPVLESITLLQPVQQGTTVSVQPLFTWDAFASDEEVIYQILLGTSEDNLSVVNNDWDNTDYVFGVDNDITLETSTVYYWRILASINGTPVAESEIQSFTTETINAVLLTENATYSKRTRASAAAFNNKLWIIGGADEAGNDLNDIWSSLDGITWSNEGTFSFGTVLGHKLIVFNNKLWLYGGIINGFTSTKIYSSDDGVNWIEETERTPFSQYNQVRMAVLNDRIYRIAGYNANFDDLSDERAVYSSTDGLNWDLLASNHGFVSKYSFWVEGIGNQLIAIEPSTDEVSITLYSSQDGITWNNLRSWETAERGYFSVKPFKINDKIILVTPPASNFALVSTFYESENGIDWTLATSSNQTFLEPRDYDFVNLNGKLYAIGGTTITTQTLSADNQVWILN